MRVKSKARTGNTVPESASGSSTAPDFRVANPVCAATVEEAESKLLDVLGRTERRKLDPNLSYGRDVIYFDV